LAAHAPLSQTTRPASPPATRADVGQWDAEIVQRAAKILASPAQWNRADTSECPNKARTFSIACALQKAMEEAAESSSRHLDCRLLPVKDGSEGSCGPMFDAVPILTIARVKAITSGRWRADVQPTEVWAGTMTDANAPVMYEARLVVESVTSKKYAGRLIGYNNDPATTFADVQAFFRALQDRLVKQGASSLDRSAEAVEIEIYAGGAGVIRTFAGWFPVTRFTVQDSVVRFQIGTAKEVAPNALDREILKRAAAIITSDAVWNRADDRNCPPAATTWSIYCAEERASIDVTGGFHHRRPALELVREIVDARSKAKSYPHRLMGYNNDPTTRLEDVRSLFAEAIARVK
jgi:hypothetical protein